jgi:diguanylate cyclase (GGDEF)-like protein
MVMTVDKDLRITFMNNRTIARIGRGDLLGRRFPEVFRETWSGDNWAALRRSLIERIPSRVMLAARTGYFEISIYPSADDGLTLFSRELTEQRRAEAELSHLALHDQLTGLPNRKQLEDFAASAIAAGNLAALILLDLDGFKHVNDTLGHPAGDEVLRDVAARLADGLAGRSMLARLGGDEFVVLLTGKRRPGEVETTAADLQKTLERQPFLTRGRLFRITASAGIAFVPSDGEVTPEVLLANADLALYRAKALGGGVCKTFNACDRQAYEAGRLLEEELDLAVERGEFELRYQPQVRLADGVVLGAEALLRWNHPRRGLLAPADFLSAIEGCRHARKVGGWILDEACRQAGEWRRAGWPLRIGVNLLAEQLKAGDLVEAVEAALQRADIPPDALTLELTENIALGQDEDVLGALRTLHARGVGVDFDDFGTGFASLTTLRDFPLTRLKIDRSFIAGLPDAPHDAAIVKAVLALARSLRLAVVAEGIETQAQADFLAARGCDEGQGYLYGQPKPASEFLKDHLARTSGPPQN